MNSKPRIFIASSTEFVGYAHAVHMFLNNKYAHTKLWESTMQPGDYTLPSLYKTFHEYDFGIFIFSPDDVVQIREKIYKTTRDNVLFEFGLFLGINGLENAFILTPDEYLAEGRIPSDLFGITISTFDSKRNKDEHIDAISSSCLSILKKLNRLEQMQLQKATTNNSSFGILDNEGEMLSQLVDLISNAQKQIVFIITSRERLVIFDLMTSIVYAKLRNIEINIHYYPLVSKYDNSFSIELFRQLGCNVKQYPVGESPENVVFIADPYNRDYSILVQKTNDDYTRRNAYAFFYKGSTYSLTITSLVKGIENLSTQTSYLPKLVSIPETEILTAFNSVPLYAQSKCQFSLITIKPESTFPRSFNYIKKFKLKQTLLLINLFNTHSFKLYEPIAVQLKNGKNHYFVPPVVEEHDEKYLIAEGHSRFFQGLEDGLPLTCILVKGMKIPLPSDPTKWDKIKVDTYGIPREFIPSFDYLDRFRKIETFLHKPDEWFPRNIKKT